MSIMATSFANRNVILDLQGRMWFGVCDLLSLLLWLHSKSQQFVSSGTDEVRAKRDPSLCNESVNGHFWSNLCLNCIFKWTWFVKTDIWSIINRSLVRFPVAAALIIFLFSSIFLSFLTRFPFCSTRISKVGKCTAFQLWTPTYFYVEVLYDFSRQNGISI